MNLNVLTVYRNPGGVLLIVIGSLVLLVTGFIRYNEYHYDLYRKSTEDVRFLDDGEYSSLIYLELVQTLTLLFLWVMVLTQFRILFYIPTISFLHTLFF